MATTTARRYVEIDVTAEKALRQLGKIEASSRRTERHLAALRSQASFVGDVFKGWAVFEVAQQLIRLSDATTNLNAQLESVTVGAEGLNEQFDALLDIANRNGAAIDSLSAAYVKLNFAEPEAGAERLNSILDTVSFTLAKTGAGVQQANAVFLQLSQGIGAGVLQGDELRSIAENAPVFLRAWAQAIGEPATAFKVLSEQGRLTKESLFENTEAIAANVKEMLNAEDPPLTVARALTQLRNRAIELTRDIQTQAPVFQALAEGIVLVANNLAELTKALTAAAAAWIAFRAAMAVQAMNAAWAVFVKNATTATGVLATLGVALKGVVGLLLGPAGLAAAVGYTVYKILDDWENFSVLVDNTNATWDLIFSTIEYHSIRIVNLVNELVRQVQLNFADLFRGWSQSMLDIGRSLESSSIPGTGILAEGVRYLAEELHDAERAMTSTANAGADLGESVLAARERMDVSIDTLVELRLESDKVKEGLRETDRSFEQMGESAGKAGGGVDKTTKELAKAEKVLRDGNTELKRYLDNLDEEILKTQLTDRELAKRTVRMELLEKATDAQNKALTAQAKGLDEVAAAYRTQSDAIREAIPLAEQKAEQLYNLQNRTTSLARTMDETLESIRTGIGDTLTDAFAKAFEGSLDSAKDFFESLKSLFTRALADIASYLVRNALTVNVTANLTAGTAAGTTAQLVSGAGGTAQTAASGFNLLGSIRNLTSTFTQGSTMIANAVTNLATRFGAGQGLGAGVGTAGAIGQAAGVAVPWAGLSGALASILGGSTGTTIGASIGSAVGAAFGSAFSPVGTVLGGLLGGGGGGFLGSLFGGGNEPDPKVIIGREAGQFILKWSQDFEAEQLSELQDTIDYVNDHLTILAEILGPDAQGALASFQGPDQALTDEVVGRWIEDVASDIAQSMFDAIGGTLGELLQQGFLDSGIGGVEEYIDLLTLLGTSINALSPGSVDTLEQAAEFFQVAGAENAQAFTQGLANLAIVMDGLETDAEKAAHAAIRLEIVFEEMGLTLPETVAGFKALVDGLDLTTQEGLATASALGALSGDLETYFNALRVQGDATGSATQRLQEFVDAALSVSSTLERTRAGVEEFGLDTVEVYRRRQEAADAIVEGLSELTDPQQILNAVGEINTLITQGWSVLTDAQKGLMQDQFLDYIDTVESLAQERLALGAAPLFGEGEFGLEGTLVDLANIMTNLDGSLGNSAETNAQASEMNLEASRNFLEAVEEMREALYNLPANIHVTTQANEVQ